MRPYSIYVSRGFFYSVSEAFDYYVEYYRTHRYYKLVSLITEVKRLVFKTEKLRE
jgi:hypothetical protein